MVKWPGLAQAILCVSLVSPLCARALKNDVPEGRSRLEITIWVYNYARVPGPVLEKARIDMTRILSDIGVNTRWIACPVVFPAVGVAVFLSRPTVPPPVITGIVQITHDGRSKLAPIVADGARLYFTEFIGGLPTPVAVPVTGGEPVPIRSPLGKASVLDISRTGDQLLVMEGVLGRDDVPIWVIPSVGGIPVRVGDLLGREAVWSPDGAGIVYIRGLDLYFATVAGTQSRRVASPPGMPYFLRWSPDGKRISVSVGDVASASLWELSADGADFRPRLPGWNNPPHDCSGSWSPDGRYFLFDSFREGPDGVWAVREEGSLFERWSSKPVLLVEGPGNAGKPVVSRDGKRVFYMAAPAAKASLARFNTRAASWAPFLSGLSAEQVSFSRLGGSLLYFRALLHGQKPSDPVLFVLDSRTSRITTIPGSGGCYYARFSPDGRYIASTRDFTRIVVLDRQTGKWEDLAKGDVYAPCWSRTSEYVYFLDWSTTGYCRVRVRDHKREQILALDCLAGGGVRNNWIEVAPDDSPIAFTTTAAEIFGADWKAP